MTATLNGAVQWLCTNHTMSLTLKTNLPLEICTDSNIPTMLVLCTYVLCILYISMCDVSYFAVFYFCKMNFPWPYEDKKFVLCCVCIYTCVLLIEEKFLVR